MAGHPGIGARGHTLAELLLVVAILGVAASVAVPALAPQDPVRLDHAAERVAQALRLARDEALRSGLHHGVEVRPDTQRVRVYRADMTSTPVGVAELVRHPLSKQPVDFSPGALTGSTGAKIVNALDPFDFGAGGRRTQLLFDPRGTPMWYVASGAQSHLLVEGRVELGYGTDGRVVTVAPYSGRVQIQ